MSDVDLLLAQRRWLAQDSVDAGPPEPHQPVELTGMPVMSRLLSKATATPVRINGVDHKLLAWGPAADRRGWLCRLPEPHNDAGIPEALRAVWTATGGSSSTSGR